MPARIDHLVIAADSLQQGAAWSEATLGVTPGPGGEHPLMGTHNRLLRIATVDYPRAYLEIIAIQPGKQAQRGRRWFDLDDEAVRDVLKRQGPRLLHFVACVEDVQASLATLRDMGLDGGEVLRASRMTQRGLLQWQIAVRPDGQRLLQGTLPTLIAWEDMHPAPALPESGLRLLSMVAVHPQAPRLRAAFEGLGLQGVQVKEGAPELCAVLATPRGRVKLSSGGL